MKSNKNNDTRPRPFKFKSSMEDFVFGSSWQADSKNKVAPSSPPLQPHNEINYERKSLYDTYNRNNLQLSMCDPVDIQILQKNPIAYEEKIVVVAQKVSNPGKKKEVERKENK